MSQPVATVDGKKVFSDKGLESIVGSRLFFTDGSWCDVSTGEVSNRGPGFINIGAPGEETQEETRGPETFEAHSLDARDLFADLDIQVHDEDAIEVTIVGPADALKNIDVCQQGDTVVIEGKDGGAVSGITMVSSGGRATTRIRSVSGAVIAGGGRVVIGGRRGVAVTGRSIVIGGAGAESETQITVKVPKGASVSVAGIDGNTTIGDTEGPLLVNARGGSDVDAGRVGSAVLNVQGSSDVTVEEVNGGLTMTIQGSGDIRVRNGRVGMLTASVQGSGDATFSGEAENATLSVMGSGDIRVNHVTNQPVTSVMGSGDIRVGNWKGKKGGQSLHVEQRIDIVGRGSTITGVRLG